MEWKRQFERLLHAGHNAFLFIGPSDGFPRPLRADAPADALFRWDECIDAPPDALAWSFDPVNGFVFKDEKEQKRFASFLVGNAPSNPVMQAANQVEGLALPRSPLEALQLMQRVLRAAAAKSPQVPCFVLLPDADAYAQATTDTTSRLTAAHLRALAENDAFRRAGHVFVLSTPAAAALDERLRRPDAPFTPVRLQRPTEDERFAFLRRICTPAAALGQAVKLRADLDAERSKRRKEADQTLRETEKALAAHVFEEALAGEGKTMEELRREEARVHAAYLEAASAVPGIVQREVRIKEIDAQLEGYLEQPLTIELWQTLREGDAVRMEWGEVGMTKVVIQRHQPFPLREENWSVTLSKSLEDRDPHLSKDGSPMRFVLTGTGLYVQVDGKAEQWKQCDELFFVPKQRLVLLSERCNWLGHLEKAIARTPDILVLKERLSDVRKQIADRKAEGHLTWQARKKEFELKIEETRIAHDSPDSPRIRELLEVIEFVGSLIKEEASKGRYSVGTKNLSEIARLSQGFGYRDLAGMVREAVAAEGLVPTAVTTRRIDILNRSYGHLFEIVDPTYGFEGVAGYEGVKAFLLATRDAMLGGAVEEVSLGCLLMGPPGTGKTAIAEAFARECGFLFVKMRNMRTMWIGESERKSEEAQQALRDLAPVVVLRDEVDEEDSGRDTPQGDSGVSARLRRDWMTFLSDPKIRGRVFVMNVTNRPDRLDAALKRSGRNDTRIPCLMPDAEVRAELFPTMLRRGRHSSTIEDFAPFAAKSDGLSGADIEVIVRRAAEFARRASQKAIDASSLEKALDDFIPSASQVTIARMSLLAIHETSFKEFLPNNAEELKKQYLERIPVQQAGTARLVLIEQGGSEQDPSKDPTGKAN